MAYLFPYAGAERARRSTPRPLKPVIEQPTVPAAANDATPPEPKVKAKRIRRKRAVVPLPPDQMPPRPPLMRQIMNEVCADHGVLPGILVGKARDASFNLARRDYVVRCARAGYSFSRIGRSMNRDHTTVLYHWQQYMNGGLIEPESKPEPKQLELQLDAVSSSP